MTGRLPDSIEIVALHETIGRFPLALWDEFLDTVTHRIDAAVKRLKSGEPQTAERLILVRIGTLRPAVWASPRPQTRQDRARTEVLPSTDRLQRRSVAWPQAQVPISFDAILRALRFRLQAMATDTTEIAGASTKPEESLPATPSAADAVQPPQPAKADPGCRTSSSPYRRRREMSRKCSERSARSLARQKAVCRPNHACRRESTRILNDLTAAGAPPENSPPPAEPSSEMKLGTAADLFRSSPAEPPECLTKRAFLSEPSVERLVPRPRRRLRARECPPRKPRGRGARTMIGDTAFSGSSPLGREFPLPWRRSCCWDWCCRVANPLDALMKRRTPSRPRNITKKSQPKYRCRPIQGVDRESGGTGRTIAASPRRTVDRPTRATKGPRGTQIPRSAGPNGNSNDTHAEAEQEQAARLKAETNAQRRHKKFTCWSWGPTTFNWPASAKPGGTTPAWRWCFWTTPTAVRPAFAISRGVISTAARRTTTRRSLATSGRVNAVAWSPDGKPIASCGQDGLLKFWDAGNAKEIGLAGRARRRSDSLSHFLNVASSSPRPGPTERSSCGTSPREKSWGHFSDIWARVRARRHRPRRRRACFGQRRRDCAILGRRFAESDGHALGPSAIAGTGGRRPDAVRPFDRLFARRVARGRGGRQDRPHLGNGRARRKKRCSPSPKDRSRPLPFRPRERPWPREPTARSIALTSSHRCRGRFPIAVKGRVNGLRYSADGRLLAAATDQEASSSAGRSDRPRARTVAAGRARWRSDGDRRRAEWRNGRHIGGRRHTQAVESRRTGRLTKLSPTSSSAAASRPSRSPIRPTASPSPPPARIQSRFGTSATASRKPRSKTAPAT